MVNSTKPVVSHTMDNNINNIIGGKGANTPSPNNNNETLTTPSDTIVWKNLKK